MSALEIELVTPQDNFISDELSELQREQLLSYSQNDVDIARRTSDPDLFASMEKLQAWLSQERKLYVLNDLPGNLCGLIWLRMEDMPSHWTYPEGFETQSMNSTIAMRLYGNSRGRGLAKPFLASVLQSVMENKPQQLTGLTGIWFWTDFDNVQVAKSFNHFGFKQLTDNSQGRKVIFAESLEDLSQNANLLASRKIRILDEA